VFPVWTELFFKPGLGEPDLASRLAQARYRLARSSPLSSSPSQGPLLKSSACTLAALTVTLLTVTPPSEGQRNLHQPTIVSMTCSLLSCPRHPADLQELRCVKRCCGVARVLTLSQGLDGCRAPLPYLPAYM
jgi:hypothetical protein